MNKWITAIASSLILNTMIVAQNIPVSAHDLSVNPTFKSSDQKSHQHLDTSPITVADAPQVRTKWEYYMLRTWWDNRLKTWRTKIDDKDMDLYDTMDLVGSWGFEFVTIHDLGSEWAFYIFKRPVEAKKVGA
jgi:hypothetical protein